MYRTELVFPPIKSAEPQLSKRRKNELRMMDVAQDVAPYSAAAVFTCILLLKVVAGENRSPDYDAY